MFIPEWNLQKLRFVSQRILCLTALTTRTTISWLTIAINLLTQQISDYHNKFADYLLENYVPFDSKFTPDMWAGIPSDKKRTNNGTESFHAHFNEQIRGN